MLTTLPAERTFPLPAGARRKALGTDRNYAMPSTLIERATQEQIIGTILRSLLHTNQPIEAEKVFFD